MQTVKKLTPGKNALWSEYQDADSLVRAKMIVELKESGLFRHWLEVASKAGHDLKNAKAKLRDIFIRLMPETAHHFGLPPIKTAPLKKAKPSIPNQPTLFE